MGRLARVFKNKRLSLSTKLRIYNSCVLSVLLYGSEAWTLLSEDGRRLQAFHMQCQCRILGIRWFDRVTNKAVVQQTGSEDIRNIIDGRRHSLFGHVRLLPDNTPAHIALHTAINVRRGHKPGIEWTRTRGRPRSTRVHQLEVDQGTPAYELWETASDRRVERLYDPAPVSEDDDDVICTRLNSFPIHRPTRCCHS